MHSHPSTVWRYKYAEFEAANFMICDLELEEVLVHNDIQLNLKNAFVNIMITASLRRYYPQGTTFPG